MAKVPKITAVITSYNEERKIVSALQSVQWADELILVDGQSTDRTVELAKGLASHILVTPNDPGMMSMRNQGIEAAGSSASGGWILILDADETIPPELAQEIKKALAAGGKYTAYRFPRKGYFLGQWIKHCGWYPDYQIRLFKKGCGYYKNEHVHEQATISKGSIGQMNIPFEHHSYYNFQEYLHKVRRYIEFEAGKLAERGKKPSAVNYLLFRPIFRFLSIYIRQGGILDGWRGLVLSIFAGYHEFMTYIIYSQQRRARVQKKQTAAADEKFLLKNFWNNPYYYELGNQFDQHFLGSHWFRLLEDYAQNAKSILDVGCGEGTNLHNLCPLSASGVGVDVSSLAVNLAKKKYPQFKFIAANAENLPFPENYFDFTYSVATLEHLTRPDRVIEEMLRVTKRGGYLAFWTYNFGSPFVKPNIAKYRTIKKIIRQSLISAYYVVKPSKKLNWAQIMPELDSKRAFYHDDDLVCEPYLQTLVSFLTHRNLKIVYADSGWEVLEKASGKRLVRIVCKLANLTGISRLPPLKYWGVNLFVIAQK